MKLHEKQIWSIRQARKRLNFWEGAVRSGKTHASIFRWITYVADAPPGELLMAGKTTRSLYRNVIKPMGDLLGRDMKYYPGKGELELWGRTIFLIGANDERAEGVIRGMTCAGAYLDEITLLPESFFTMLLSRMSVTGAKLFGSTNPDAPRHWFKVKYLDRRNELDIAVFRFMIEDNPSLDPMYVSALKMEYVGLWYKRYILSQWVMAEGAIYDFFDEEEHCVHRFPKAKFRVAGVDYGTSNPTAFGLYGVDFTRKTKIWKEKEYYYDPTMSGRQKTDLEFALDLRDFVKGKNVRHIFVDPSAASFKLQCKRKGVLGIKDADNDVIDGIRTTSSMLKNGSYKIGDNCKKNIEQKGGYVWDPKQQKYGIDAPVKVEDHTQDEERYVLHSMFGTRKYDLLDKMNTR